jgi:hypothetical protein
VKRTSTLLVALFAAVLTIGPSWVSAQAAAPAKAAGTAKAGGAEKKRPAPRKVLRLEEMKVEGRIQKPQAMFLMPRANLNYGELDRSEPVLPKVKEAVEKAPF